MREHSLKINGYKKSAQWFAQKQSTNAKNLITNTRHPQFIVGARLQTLRNKLHFYTESKQNELVVP